jgi:hypothetical protein
VQGSEFHSYDQKNKNTLQKKYGYKLMKSSYQYQENSLLWFCVFVSWEPYLFFLANWYFSSMAFIPQVVLPSP